MSLGEKHEEHLDHHKEMHEAMMKNWRSWGSWFSWGSPVGMGIWLICAGIFIFLLRLAVKY